MLVSRHISEDLYTIYSLIEYFYSNTGVNEIAVNRLVARNDLVTHKAKLPV